MPTSPNDSDAVTRKQAAELKQREALVHQSVFCSTKTGTMHELQLLADSHHGPVARVDRHLRCMFVNGYFLKLFGLERSEVIGKYLSDVVPEEFYLQIEPYTFIALAGKAFSFECRFRDSMGDSCNTIINLVPDPEIGDEFGGFFVFGTDITELKQAEESQERSQRQLQLIADHYPGPVLCLDRESRFTFVNEHYLRRFSRRREDVTGRHFREIVSNDAAEYWTGIVDRALAGETDQFELTTHEADRSQRTTFLFNVVPDISKHGEIDAFYVFGIDITNQKAAEYQLLTRERELREILNSLPGPVSRIDTDMKLTFVNGIFESLAHTKLESIQGLHIREVVGHDDFSQIEDHLERALAGEKVIFESVQERQDEGTSYAMVYLVPDRDSQHKVTGVFILSFDITQAKVAEISLQSAMQKLEQAQAVAKTGNWSYEVATGKTFWSPQLFHLFERDSSLGAALYPEVLQRFHPSDVELVDAAFLEAMRDGKSYSVIARTNNSTNGINFLRCEGRASRGESGKIEELYGTVTDVTNEIERERELREAQRKAEIASLAKTEFLANMSHEIRTPLTAILGFAELLREENASDLDEKERALMFDAIKRSGDHLLMIINDILDISKIEAHKTVIERVATSLPDLLNEIEGLMQPQATGKGIDFSVALDTPIPSRILTDPTRLRQILLNLVGNAIKFTEAGSISVRIRYRNEPNGSHLSFEVEDTGCGVSEEQKRRLFEPFMQADNTITRTHGGTGLGLAISKRLANLMGGEVELIRSSPGVGTTFRLQLPCDVVPSSEMYQSFLSELSASGRPRLSPELVQLRGRILLVEDGIDNQKLIAFHLRKAGATVEVANNGREALTIWEKAKSSGPGFDLLITDIQMPEMDGYALARSLRSKGATLPIIALTAHALPEDREKCLNAGCDDYESKPIVKSQLLATCARLLSAKQAEPESDA